MTGPPSSLDLEWIAGRYAVCRLHAMSSVPAWARDASGLVSVTRTDRELSIVIDDAAVPSDVTAERGFAALRVVGTLDFQEVGILSSLTGALAAAGVSVLAISTYDTDILLVRDRDRERACDALGGIGEGV